MPDHSSQFSLKLITNATHIPSQVDRMVSQIAGAQTEIEKALSDLQRNLLLSEAVLGRQVCNLEFWAHQQLYF